ncbi:hypothetical protein BV87_20225 [Sphingobium yanoikuyae]|uniref:Uncharacterized protein n=1 Tax=Sphingobium yanoikuyae TaxID=13690 RepID=A0A2D1R6K6_SPHYA|nr:hypothetical protein BV87_20225 [Sphingobium yanoikuyae]TKV35586.1 hypothetical protein A0U87_25120 [Sphingobium sp. MP9-4]
MTFCVQSGSVSHSDNVTQTMMIAMMTPVDVHMPRRPATRCQRATSAAYSSGLTNLAPPLRDG